MNKVNEELEQRVNERTSQLENANNALRKEIEERIRMEQALKTTEATLKTIFENTNVGLILINPGYRIVTYNAMIDQLAKNFLDTSLAKGLNVRELLLAKKVSHFDDTVPVLKQGGHLNYEIQYPDRNGLLSWFQINCKAVTDEKNSLIGMCFAINDITFLKEAENEIRILNDGLEKRVKDRTEELEAFSYSVSHDLRAPLRAIHGYAKILEADYNKVLDNNGLRLIHIIKDNALRMGKLIDDLLAFFDLGKKKVIHCTVEMHEIVEKCIKELIKQRSEIEYKINIESLPDCIGDPAMIKQVWINLVSNAMKYSANSKKPKINIGFKDDLSMYIYFVNDNGVGFDMKYKGKLFGVFERLHSDSEFEGTGIGLALVKQIINKHKGEIWAESYPGKGATFYFSIPKYPDDEE